MFRPTLGDKQNNPQDAEEFVRAFESICKIANNARGMNDLEMVVTLANCLTRTRKLLYESVIADAMENGTMNARSLPEY